MKKLVLLILLTLLTITAFCQTETETIKKANDLIANKKYESAFKLLDSFDKKNEKPDIVLLKEDILLNYFVSSLMHEMFALKDLKMNETVEDYRGKEGQYAMFRFDADTIIGDLMKTHPQNGKLYNGLGNFYYEVQTKYSGNWLKDDKELFRLIEVNDKKAIETNCADFMTYFVMGYVNIAQEKYKEAIPYFLKSIELNKDYAGSYYNVAYAYMYIDDRENALKNAKISLDLYTDISFKGDAARMLGQIYSEMKDNKNALLNYELSDKIDPDNYYTIKPILDLYLKTGNLKTITLRNSFFKLGPGKPTIYNDLEEIYSTYSKQDELIAFYKEKLPEYKDDAKVLGNLNFYLGRIYLDKDKKEAKAYFLKAKDILSKVYAKDHAVFNAIQDGIDLSEK